MMINRYNGTRIKRGLSHFIIGKGISAVAGLLCMLLVIRELSVESFAAYSVLTALVELLTALSGLGLAHALLRYVPELYAKQYQVSLQKLTYGAFGIRTAVLLLAVLIAFIFAEQFAPQIGLSHAIDAYQVFLLVVIFRSSTHFLSQILESTLHQSIVQIGFTTATLVRLAGMLVLLQQDSVNLVDVIRVEAISDLTGLLIMMCGVVWVITRKPNKQNNDDDGSWLKQNMRQIAKFAVAGYVQHLAISPAGGHTNRLVGGSMLSLSAMATFGYAQSLYEYIKRYLPAQLLVGLIRPVVVARFVEKRDFGVAASLCGQVLQINILLIFGLFALLIVGGSEALDALSAGKYGFNALIILVALFVVILLETQRQQLELLAQTVERYQYLIPSNLLLSSSILLAVILIPLIGALAFPIANGAGLIAANAWMQRKMQAAGFIFKHDWFLTARTIAIAIVATIVGELAQWAGVIWYLAAALSLSIYVVLTYVFCSGMLKSFMRDLTGQGALTLPVLPENALETISTHPATTGINKNNHNEKDDHSLATPLHIAFGILSSKQSAQAIDEIAAAVFPHNVYVHHDFTKQPDFNPKAVNIVLITNPVSTNWGDWSLVEATCRLMQKAFEDKKITHFQLLSESCLLIQPVQAFEQFLSTKMPDAMIDILSLQDSQAMVSHGWRYYPQSNWSMRIVRRATVWVWGNDARHLPKSSINLRLADKSQAIFGRAKQVLGLAIIKAYAASANRTLHENGLQQFAIGGQWFGVNRRTGEWLLSAQQEFAAITAHFKRCHIPDEAYLHTLILNAQLMGLPLRIYPSNHVLFWHQCQTGPDLITPDYLTQVQNSGKFFARKFSLDAQDTARKNTLLSMRNVAFAEKHS